MKMCISTLLLTIEVLLKVGELYATEGEPSSSGSGKRGSHGGALGRPRGHRNAIPDGVVRGTFRVNTSTRLRSEVIASTVSAERTHDKIIMHKGVNIQVWLDEHQNIVQAVYPGHKCPARTNDYRYRQFLVRLVILETGQRFVECIDDNGTLLGVRAWRQTTQNIMEPNSTQWFINYMSTQFRVRINPETGAPVSISLASKDESAPPEGHPVELVPFADFEFILYKGEPNGQITGAALPVRPSSPSRTQLIKFL